MTVVGELSRHKRSLRASAQMRGVEPRFLLSPRARVSQRKIGAEQIGDLLGRNAAPVRFCSGTVDNSSPGHKAAVGGQRLSGVLADAHHDHVAKRSPIDLERVAPGGTKE